MLIRPSRSLPDYVELKCVSNFTFLRGASAPDELVERAQELGYQGLAITDECSMAGVVRAHVAAKAAGLPLLLGSQFQLQPRNETEARFTVVVLAQNLNGYGNLCAFITKLRRSSEKGTYHLTLDHISGTELEDCVVLLCPDRKASEAQLEEAGLWTLNQFTGRCWIGVEQLRRLDDELWLHRMRQLSELTALPLVAVGDVHMHVRSRKPLQDVLTATRIGKPLSECGFALQRSAEQHLRTRLRLAQTFPAELLAETLQVAARCTFNLDELKYQYPDEVVPAGHTAATYLRQATYEGAGRRWPAGIPGKVQGQIEHELSLICELRYEHYFLTVFDIVAFARSRNILCQGRGSAANSVVCYCLGVTEVDPARMSVLFERFISKERNEPPDIDIDFEHQRREEVIQYLYQRYGRDRAALTAAVISYRPKSAIRDVGKALGFDLATVDAIAKGQKWFDGADVRLERFDELGMSVDDLAVRQLITLTSQLIGFPRHLSQHTGGFVLTRDLLCRMVPVENASMADRTVIEWDKDDLDAAGLLKVDVLALGMLSAIRRALDMVGRRRGHQFSMQDIPPEDRQTYQMISMADTVGVFQIESRAQMSMLPRLRPKCFYDLVIEVALVRPGPIQGGMVHPYLRRRQGHERVSYPSKELEVALGRTLGVPIFQEQVMQISMIAAGFTAGEADGLRRAMAAWKRKGGLEKYYDKIVQGMLARGYEKSFAESTFQQIRGFSEYGFPESHAASFALLVYASSWIKRHEPAAFLAALLNSQPMGFYTPSQLVQDARRHGVEVRAVDVMYSDVESTLEDLPNPPAVRLGLHMIRGLHAASAARIMDARRQAPFDNAEELARRALLEHHEMKLLAAAGALATLSGHRRQQVWDAAALHAPPELLQEAPVDEEFLELPAAPEGEEVVWDYASLGLTLRSHPMALLRKRLEKYKLKTSAELRRMANGRSVRTAGIVTLRQQPETANGTVFLSLEDEHGTTQVIVWRDVRDAQRQVLLGSRLLAVKGRWQRQGMVCNLIAERLADLSPLLGRLATESRDFR
ncbi:MAG: error-prone DNA polymerase [Acidovorax sp. SCN 65-108]|uniref:error-prone DNA polymerase n=2 Tax=Pseudomonadota TaxID=1224 RepID=UPI00086C8E02|nr:MULTISPECIES: error-prone DNA polymerase [unclassified Acidovorax]MBW8465911.1 error-prone DNA polymerase [Acidovorax sp.]ODS59832.1 MAG: error-prone DNA polymerase [Acidovorax sp. SCN 65-108]OJV67020.1 MAG: error-prone DNA polymerase [Burkholderiales bacterium 64-34]RKR52878.1 error-prone DNA polymerase [Acidovorax sp. 94]